MPFTSFTLINSADGAQSGAPEEFIDSSVQQSSNTVQRNADAGSQRVTRGYRPDTNHNLWYETLSRITPREIPEVPPSSESFSGILSGLVRSQRQIEAQFSARNEDNVRGRTRHSTPPLASRIPDFRRSRADFSHERGPRANPVQRQRQCRTCVRDAVRDWLEELDELAGYFEHLEDMPEPSRPATTEVDDEDELEWSEWWDSPLRRSMVVRGYRVWY